MSSLPSSPSVGFTSPGSTSASTQQVKNPEITITDGSEDDGSADVNEKDDVSAVSRCTRRTDLAAENSGSGCS